MGCSGAIEAYASHCIGSLSRIENLKNPVVITCFPLAMRGKLSVLVVYSCRFTVYYSLTRFFVGIVGDQAVIL